jgi:hypothetical protein
MRKKELIAFYLTLAIIFAITFLVFVLRGGLSIENSVVGQELQNIKERQLLDVSADD